ncbi:TetR/AcrR family transcriptional regulator [Actinotalea ferrariae]|uniref:TetR/AcrR family transcriptional regulator n=1 Tax=Actinotalea ferrariae TaxID=1386098 RepID=UPI001C8BDCDB|nr:TetR/AcrR family transcriptional regulator [Actinotalea ferrariae]MBX9245693.1 TetR/AcrR family transcriptional regulator [Actinotalea ferrariae]
MVETTDATRRRTRLTRDAVLRRAVAIADEHGVEALTMRRLAEELGVEAMSLYHHVRGKDGILDGALELVLDEMLDAVSRLEPPDLADPRDWQPAVRARILAARTVMLRHRWTPQVMEARNAMTLSAARHVDGIVALMRAGGFSWDLVHHGLHALGSRVHGFTQELGEPEGGDAEAEAVLAQIAPHIPHLVAMFSEVAHDEPGSTLGWCDDQTEFEFGLDLVLDGLERLARQG